MCDFMNILNSFEFSGFEHFFDGCSEAVLHTEHRAENASGWM